MHIAGFRGLTSKRRKVRKGDGKGEESHWRFMLIQQMAPLYARLCLGAGKGNFVCPRF